MKDAKAAGVLNYALYVPKVLADGLSIEYEFSDGKNYAKKSFQFSKNGYLSQVISEVTQASVPVEHMLQWRGGFGDATVPNRLSEPHSVYYDLAQKSTFSSDPGKLITKDATTAIDCPQSSPGIY